MLAQTRRCIAEDHGWMFEFVQHPVADSRILRPIQTWLKAGVMEGREWPEAQKGNVTKSIGHTLCDWPRTFAVTLPAPGYRSRPTLPPVSFCAHRYRLPLSRILVPSCFAWNGGVDNARWILKHSLVLPSAPSPGAGAYLSVPDCVPDQAGAPRPSERALMEQLFCE